MSRRRMRSLLVIVVFALAIAKVLADRRPTRILDVSRHPTVDGGDRPPSPASDPYQAPVVEPAAIDPSLADLPPLEMAAPPGPGRTAAATTVDETAADGTVHAEPVGDRTWVPALDDACPDGFPIKAKLSSGIYHAPGQTAYERTSPDRCYPSTAAAEDDGLRAAKR